MRQKPPARPVCGAGRWCSPARIWCCGPRAGCGSSRATPTCRPRFQREWTLVPCCADGRVNPRPGLKALLLAALLPALLLAGCGGGGSSRAPEGTPPVVLPAGANVLALTVDTGPTGNSVNRPYASVTLCEPGGARCQTLDRVLVDSGSTGLRVLASEVSGLALDVVRTPQGQPLLNCTQFVDNTSVWGPVVTASVKLGQKSVDPLAVQLIGSADYAGLNGACGSGVSMDTVAGLGAQGILGVGLFQQDCGNLCASVTRNGSYFSCRTAACTSTQPVTAPLAQQLANPVALLGEDNNGLVFELPAVGPDGAATLTGRLLFGIGTQPNNAFDAGLTLPTSTTGRIQTEFNGQMLTDSFIDSGSNALFFDAATLTPCSGTGAIRFYCPPVTTPLSARLLRSDGASALVTFSVGNADQQFAAPLKAALPGLAGSLGDASSFNWGLPFFYGRRVFIGIEGRSSPGGTGPYYAF
ncbi:MAG: DUF3443 family protein [Rhodoferax sp.]|nr:DUF3443 family protein [Rhodoferax sp.]